METTYKRAALNLYLILAAIFIALLLLSNLIFQKFFFWNPLPFLSSYTFEVSVGILPYPLTFLVTDIISELFGRKMANKVVISGLFASILVFILVLIAEQVPATSWSPVSDEEFSHVFGKTGLAVGASMLAYLSAQLIDVRLFHFWKKLTKGKHLWLRNNFSTITSQFVDTALVIGLLCAFGAIEWALFPALLLNGFLFKVMVALFDTPIIYLVVWIIRRKMGNLAFGEEFKIMPE